MPRAKVTKGTVSNTFVGSTNKRGEFIHDVDESGKWIKSSNLKMVAPEGYTMKKLLSSSIIEGFASTYPDLKVEPNTDYVLVSQNTLDANAEKDLDPAVVGFYKPLRKDCPLP